MRIGIDLIALPEVSGFRYAVVAIDYFSKWSEVRPLSDKRAVSVARFIYDDIMCLHGSPKIEISDQGKGFCNDVCQELFRMTGTTLEVTSPYHPRANGLVERFNRTIKNSLLKVCIYLIIYCKNKKILNALFRYTTSVYYNGQTLYKEIFLHIALFNAHPRNIHHFMFYIKGK